MQTDGSRRGQLVTALDAGDTTAPEKGETQLTAPVREGHLHNGITRPVPANRIDDESFDHNP